MRVIIKTKCPLYEFLVFTKDIKPGLMLCKTNIFFLEWATFMSSEYWLGLKEATWSDAAVSQNWRKKLNIKFLSFFFTNNNILSLDSRTKDRFSIFIYMLNT